MAGILNTEYLIERENRSTNKKRNLERKDKSTNNINIKKKIWKR